MWVRLANGIGAERWDTLRILSTYLSATLFAYLSRVFWPIPVTPHVVSVALKATRNLASEVWRSLAA
jgi:hypothetical protein